MSNAMWWYLTRASGLTAWVFLTLTLVWGAVAASKVLNRKGARRWLLDLHPYLGGLGLSALVLHVVSAVADTTVHLRWIDTIVPFISSWNPLGVALGVLGVWLLLAVETTSMARRRLDRRTWRRIHLLSYAGAALTTGHAITAGTDIGRPVVAWSVIALSAVALAAAALRAAVTRETPGPTARPARPVPPTRPIPHEGYRPTFPADQPERAAPTQVFVDR